MSNCSNHKKDVAGISDMKVLAEMIGDLHYETLTELLVELNIKLYRDSKRDCKIDRERLSHHLSEASFEMGKSAHHIYKAWQISKPFMTNK